MINKYKYFTKYFPHKIGSKIAKETFNATCPSKVAFYRKKAAAQGLTTTQKRVLIAQTGAPSSIIYSAMCTRSLYRILFLC